MSEPQTVFGVGERDRGKRLDRFLNERIPGVSRAYIQRAIRARVTLSWGVSPRPSTPVRPGGEVRIGYTPIAETLLDLAIPVLDRGERWIAVDKPPGIPVHPVNKIRENSLIRMLRRQEGDDALRLVHRLDSETSGVLLVAVDAATARALAGDFEHGRVHKEYLAIVRGVVESDEGMIDLPIGDARGSRVYVRREAGETGQPARTAFKVELRMAGRTLLRLFPETGRRHQIRVHLAAIGHPVLGDMIYGRPDRDYLDMVRGVRDARREEGGPLRHLLHCAKLRFLSPWEKREVEVVAPVPRDFEPASGTSREVS